MRNRTILCFDLDGVLLDNTLLGFLKVNQILVELKLPPVSPDFLREHWGKKMDDLADLICHLQGASKEQTACFKKREKEIHPDYVFDRGLLRALVTLPQFGFLTAIITSREEMDFRKYTRKIGLNPGIFHYIQTTDDYPCHKPNGNVFIPLINWAHDLGGGATAENIVYFGDTIKYDYRAVINARLQGRPIKFVGVCSGINTYKEFRDAGLEETEIIPSHDNLSFYLNRLIQERVREKKKQKVS
ncbi:MAG: HAD hydrolase-like protein [Candidatus Falkowbacteria bacterium]|nr:HAD hydrolase-like protein [Candidatus Falkowbacteria bacterium]